MAFDIWFMGPDGAPVKVSADEQDEAAADYLAERVKEAHGV